MSAALAWCRISFVKCHRSTVIGRDDLFEGARMGEGISHGQHSASPTPARTRVALSPSQAFRTMPAGSVVLVTEVWILQHVSHAVFSDGTFNPHVNEEDGDLWWDEEAGDDIKMIGVYSSQAKCLEAVERARRLPGFRQEPNCFLLAPYDMDGEDGWTEGFARVLSDDSDISLPEEWSRLAAEVEMKT
jgi:hypothetical protein